MGTQRPFRFGVVASSAASMEDWQAKARRAEELGYATLLVPDHFSASLSPVPALQAAASATTRLRVGSFVFDNDYRHPALLQQEVATLDVLTGVVSSWALVRVASAANTSKLVSPSMRQACGSSASRKPSRSSKGCFARSR